MPTALKMESEEVRSETKRSSSENVMSRCGGCDGVISDRYYLLAVDRQWHCQCLKCHHCGLQLESQLTCFSRAGFIYCKNDYYQLFSWQKCARCALPIQPKQLVMRINIDCDNSHYYHVDCFTCATCGEKLRKGDYFGKHNNDIYCQFHFQLHYHPNHSHSPPLLKVKLRGRKKSTHKFDRCKLFSSFYFIQFYSY